MFWGRRKEEIRNYANFFVTLAKIFFFQTVFVTGKKLKWVMLLLKCCHTQICDGKIDLRASLNKNWILKYLLMKKEEKERRTYNEMQRISWDEKCVCNEIEELQYEWSLWCHHCDELCKRRKKEKQFRKAIHIHKKWQLFKGSFSHVFLLSI